MDRNELKRGAAENAAAPRFYYAGVDDCVGARGSPNANGDANADGDAYSIFAGRQADIEAIVAAAFVSIYRLS